MRIILQYFIFAMFLTMFVIYLICPPPEIMIKQYNKIE